MAETAVPGCRVKVRFAGQDVDGFVVERAATSEHAGTPHAAAAGGERRAGADARGRRADRVARRPLRRHPLRRAPARGAAAARDRREAGVARRARRPVVDRRRRPRGLGRARAGRGLPRPPGRRRIAAGGVVGRARPPTGRCCSPTPAPRRTPPGAARWSACPTAATSTGSTRGAGRGAGGGPPRRADRRPRAGRALPRLPRRLARRRGASSSAPARRPSPRSTTSAWSRSGTTATTSTPSRARPTPTPARCCSPAPSLEGAGVLVGGFARTVEAAYLLRSGWAHELAAPRDLVRQRVQVAVAGASDAELHRDPLGPVDADPARRRTTRSRQGLRHGPVLVQTPRTGYVPSLACERCRTPARCTTCTGPLALRGPTDPPRLPLVRHRRRGLGVRHLRPPRPARPGARRPPHRRGAGPLLRPHADPLLERRPGPRDACAARPEIVVATPGAEPVAEGGYAAVVLLDTWLPLARADLRTDEEALRRWVNAAGLVAARRPGARRRRPRPPRAAGAGAVGPRRLRRARDRRSGIEAHLPPASRLATITGEPGAVDDALHAARRRPRRPRCSARSTSTTASRGS